MLEKAHLPLNPPSHLELKARATNKQIPQNRENEHLKK